ncbi:UDP-glucose 4-epimerase GalE [Candidatus Protochlamydia phocaeensis]|uniref:UDP-glucose 4-epimerase GalE n=1 Tax=Candidatus Protochlamydia phocaeensis TaxID=1414722 RepID=UPI0008380D54|nr:UDP-glucose 4-epimerase GalE [Candidatus Protochlamydia phocaeensis]
MHKPTILIAGGAGFIGSHVNKMLHRAGYQTIVLDNLSRGNAKTVCYGTFVQGDIGDAAFLDKLFADYSIDAVMHFAAFINVGESVQDPWLYYTNNVSNTLALLGAMLRHGIKSFIFSSTAAIFGQPNVPLIKEDQPCHPINPYGESKWMVEKILQDFDTAYGLKFCCLRYFNAAGGDPEGEIKNYQPKASNLIPLILQSLKKAAGQVTIFGTDYPTPDGTCIRDYIHIEDLGEAHIKALEQILTGMPSNFYNLGNGKGFSVREVIQTVEKVLEKKVNTVEGARRPGDPAVLLADPAKAMSELNWHPRYSLEQMIEHAWRASLESSNYSP